MIKQKYLGELRRLLVFMTDEDREAAIERYGALFDQASPDGLEVFTEALGSPTKNAIRLSRGYEPGSIPELPGLEGVPGLALDVLTAEQRAGRDSGAPSDSAAGDGEGADTAVPWVELPEFELPDIEADGFELPTADETETTETAEGAETVEPVPQAEAQEPSAPSEEPSPAGEAETPAGPSPAEEAPEAPGEEKSDEAPLEEESAEASTEEAPAEEKPAEAPPEAAPAQEPKLVEYEVPEHVLPTEHTPLPPEPKRYMPLWVGIPLFALVMLAVGLPLAPVVIGLFALLLVPGAALLFLAWLVFVGGLWCGAYIADAVMMFGAAFIVLALGLAVLWLCLWLGVIIVRLYIRGVRAMGRLCFGRREVSKNA